MRVLRGRALLNQSESRFTFVQNEPTRVRSKQVYRTEHSRLVRRPDGKYTLTLRFDAGEKYVVSALQAEVRNAAKMAVNDMNNVGWNAKLGNEQKQEGGEE